MRLVRFFLALLLLAIAAVAINRAAIPNHNTAVTHFDTIIVLGYPANPDGTPSPDERERVLEAVRQYKAGIAPAIIMTGGAAHNRFVEAHVMAAFAISQGIPAEAITEERQAQNTIQNIFYSSEIMRSHQWHSAEVISSSAHLGRAAMILQAFPKSHPGLAFDWRTHPASWPAEYSLIRRAFTDSLEASRCLQIRIFGFPKSRFLPKG
ncbi:YdcF family protein [Granulicella aggregans]|uniref:YdcF family protein n=1 Tax=Granulicella aggregans TaxID=474949 RepID=UPI0021E0AA6E|nr:YdcF family protein [Granulicella aggregans]